jgi:hypothetical protein
MLSLKMLFISTSSTCKFTSDKFSHFMECMMMCHLPFNVNAFPDGMHSLILGCKNAFHEGMLSGWRRG